MHFSKLSRFCGVDPEPPEGVESAEPVLSLVAGAVKPLGITFR